MTKTPPASAYCPETLRHDNGQRIRTDGDSWGFSTVCSVPKQTMATMVSQVTMKYTTYAFRLKLNGQRPDRNGVEASHQGQTFQEQKMNELRPVLRL